MWNEYICNNLENVFVNACGNLEHPISLEILGLQYNKLIQILIIRIQIP